MSKNVANQFFDYAVNARSSYSPTAMNSGSAPAVNGWTAVKVEKFRADSPDFSAQMYTDGQGNYRFSMRGSETSNYAGDFRTADVALMAGKWDAQLADGIRFVGEAILQIKDSDVGRSMRLDDIRAIMDGSGHSLGGAIYEAAASFWGLRGMSIDGPGVAKQIASPEFQAIKDEYRARGLSDLQDSYEWQEGDFQARQYTIVGAAEVHADGVNVYTAPKMDALLTDISDTPPWAVAAAAGHKFAWELVGSVAGHPMAAIFKLEGMGDVDLRLLQLERQRNVASGLSANGYEVDTAHYEPIGKPVTIGTGSAASTQQSMVQVTTYKDPITGAIMEVRMSGTRVDGQFIASGTAPLVIGMDTAGRTVLAGAAVHTIAAAQLSPPGGNANTTGTDPLDAGADATTVSASDPLRAYDRVSIQNHKDGTTSFTFQSENGQTAWVLPNGEGGRVVVLTNGAPVEGEPHTITYELDASGQYVGSPRYYDANGVEVSDTGGTLPADALNTSHLNLDAITIPDLANALAPGESGAVKPDLGGAYGYGQINGFDILPLNETSSFLLNIDGDIVGEMNLQADGTLQLKNLSGGAVYVVGDRVLTQAEYDAAQRAQAEQQAQQAATAIGLMNSIIGLQHWDAMSDLQRTAALVSIYNTVDVLSGGDALPGNLGAAAGMLGLLNALDQGNVGAAMVSGIALVNSLTNGAASAAIGSALNINATNVIPGLNLILALDSGDPVSVIAAACAFIPVYGQIIAAVITICNAIFGGEDIPMSEGAAHAQWDAAGNLQIVTDQDEHGGGPTAEGWMSALAHGLQEELARHTDEHGAPLYGLIPNLLPTVGFKHDPDGFNYGSAQGHLFLSWVDDNGVTQTRYYDGAGNRNDGTGQTLAGDFMQHAMDAIAPAWAVQTTLAHWQAGSGLHLPLEKASLPQESEDGVSQDSITQTLQVLTLGVPGFEPPPPVHSLIDVDADGYLEATQWVQANQAMLAIDVNGDGYIGAGELLNLQGSQGDGAAFNNVHWLDANQDGRLDASDPAFAALRLWMDVNGDGISQNRSGNEAQSLTQAGITAIDFAAHPPSVTYADGSTRPLTAQMLTAETRGVAYQLTEGGLLETSEQADGSGVTVLAAVNTRAFDGQEGHVHGGQVDAGSAAAEGAGRAPVLIDVGDDRVVQVEGAAVASAAPVQTSTEVGVGDARLTDAGSGSVRSGQGKPVFVPVGALAGASTGTTAQAGQATQATQATQALLQGAPSPLGTGGLDLSALTAIALGAGAVQWPVVSSAEAPDAAAPFVPPAPGTAAAQPDPVSPPASCDVPPSAATALPPTGAATPIEAPGSMPPAPGTSGAQTGSSTPAAPVFTSVQSAGPAAASATGWASGSMEMPATPPGNGQPSAEAFMLVAPSVSGEHAQGDEDTVLRFSAASLLANDSTLNTAAALRISAVFSPVHGSVSLHTDAQGEVHVRFVPEPDYHGPVAFSYTVSDPYGLSRNATVTLDIAPVNDAPVARTDHASGDEDHTLLFTPASLLANDSDVDSPHADLRIVSVDNATHGTVSLTPEGAIRFVPEADYFGEAQFTYTVSDGAGGFTVGTASLTIAPVNDAPRLVGEALAVDEDTQLRIATAALLANDTDVDNPHTDLRITAVGDATHGSVQLVNGPNGPEIVFTPEPDFFGAASFSYTVDDGAGGLSQASVALTFHPVNDAPLASGELIWGKRDIAYTLTPAALLANDTDVDTPHADLRIVEVANAQHGSATLHPDGRVTFVPEAGYAGRGSFDYWVQDPQGARSMATAQIDFSRINQAPTATDDSFTGYEDVPFVIASAQLLANDTDTDSDTTQTTPSNAGLRITAVADATNGTVSLDAQGNVTFVPRADFHGTASFRYQVSDPEGASTWAQAVLSVQSVNDAPVIEDIWYGRPIYGYQKISTYHSDNGWNHTYQLVSDAAAAQALVSGGGVLYRATTVQERNSDGDWVTVTHYSTVVPTYYLNGQMRPIEIDTTDATIWGAQYEGGFELLPWDDPYRQNGGIVAYDPDGNSSAITFSLGTAPQHGHAWINSFTPDSVDGMIPYTEAGSYAVASQGAWQYYSHRGDTYDGSDPFTIQVTDGQGDSTTVTIGAIHKGLSPAGGGCPIVIDMANDGIDLIRPEDSNVFMDINDDGWRDRIGWAAPADAILVLDANRDGRVDIDHEVSFVDHLPGARTDLEGLAAHDSDGDGWITAADARWKDFGLFQDRNANGVQDAGEFVSLDQAGLQGISLTREGSPQMNQGNVVFGTSQVLWADGSATRAGDVMFAGDGVPIPEAAQMALLFAQYAALPPSGASDPATVFVPATQDDASDAWAAAAAASAMAGAGMGNA